MTNRDIVKSKAIVFIVRASINDGLGHLIRSLLVLQEAIKLIPVHLIVLGDSSGAHLVEDSEVSWTYCTADEDAVTQALDFSPRIVVFDMLRFDACAFERIAKNVVTVTLSPVFSQMSKTDYLFHRTTKENPSWRLSKDFPIVYKGLQYTVLPSWLRRLRTSHYRECLNEAKLSIAISMGGADAPNRTLGLLKSIGLSQHKLVVWVALGDAYTHSYEDLLKCAKENRQEIILVKSNESMWRVLKNASLVICAGGLTTYEAAYIGLPTINILQHSDWEYLFDELVEYGACYTIKPANDSLYRAVELTFELIKNPQKLLQMHLATKKLIPVGGARRIASKLNLFTKSNVNES